MDERFDGCMDGWYADQAFEVEEELRERTKAIFRITNKKTTRTKFPIKPKVKATKTLQEWYPIKDLSFATFSCRVGFPIQLKA